MKKALHELKNSFSYVFSCRYPIKNILKTRLPFWITDKSIDKWLNGKNIFFILAIGRSGTKFLSDLLNKDNNAIVCHEPVKEDKCAYQIAFYDEKKAHKYVQFHRKKEIYFRLRKMDFSTYGEVNSFLRRHCNALKAFFPSSRVIHLIRDGRDVVRSMMARKTMTREDLNTKHIFPDNKYLKKEWKSLDRFQKICWYWKVENEFLRKNTSLTIKFEDILSDYSYLRDQLLDNIGIYISKEVWQKATKMPKNTTKNHNIPKWENWTEKKKKQFIEICGEEMKANSYSIKEMLHENNDPR